MTVALAGIPARLGTLETQVAAQAAALLAQPIKVTQLPGATKNTGIGVNWVAHGANLLNLANNTALQTMVNVTGSGYLELAALSSIAAASDTTRIVIAVDGRTILDDSMTRSSNTFTLVGLAAMIGPMFSSTQTSGVGPISLPVYFRTSLTIQASKSNSTNVVACLYRYTLIDLTSGA